MKTIVLLSLSNVFMTFAWYAHLRYLRDNSAGSRIGQRSAATLAPTHNVQRGEPQGWGDHKPWIIAALLSWGVALFEYLLQVPANRAGYGQFDLGQLKIMQEIIALTVFVPFAIFYMREPLRLDFDAHHPWRAALRAELKFAQFRSWRNCLWAGLCLVGAAYFMFRAPISGAV
jgi:uncharacterized protein (DUF486 family)